MILDDDSVVWEKWSITATDVLQDEPVAKQTRSRKRRAGAACGFAISEGQRGRVSAKQQARLPADALGGSTQLFERPVLDLTDALLADPQQVPDLPEAVRAVAG